MIEIAGVVATAGYDRHGHPADGIYTMYKLLDDRGNVVADQYGNPDGQTYWNTSNGDQRLMLSTPVKAARIDAEVAGLELSNWMLTVLDVEKRPVTTLLFTPAGRVAPPGGGGGGSEVKGAVFPLLFNLGTPGIALQSLLTSMNLAITRSFGMMFRR